MRLWRPDSIRPHQTRSERYHDARKQGKRGHKHTANTKFFGLPSRVHCVLTLVNPPLLSLHANKLQDRDDPQSACRACGGLCTRCVPTTWSGSGPPLGSGCMPLRSTDVPRHGVPPAFWGPRYRLRSVARSPRFASLPAAGAGTQGPGGASRVAWSRASHEAQGDAMPPPPPPRPHWGARGPPHHHRRRGPIRTCMIDPRLGGRDWGSGLERD